MVDALRAAHRAIRPGGTLIDLRPDSTHQPRLLRGRADLGGLVERPIAVGDNAASDRAVSRFVRAGLIRPIRSGHFWYRFTMPDLAALDEFVETSLRIGRYGPGARARLAREPDRPIVIRRALAYGIYERL